MSVWRKNCNILSVTQSEIHDTNFKTVLVCWKNGAHVHLIIFERHTVAHHDQTFNIRMISDIMIPVQLAIKIYIFKKRRRRKRI